MDENNASPEIPNIDIPKLSLDVDRGYKADADTGVAGKEFEWEREGKEEIGYQVKRLGPFHGIWFPLLMAGVGVGYLHLLAYGIEKNPLATIYAHLGVLGLGGLRAGYNWFKNRGKRKIAREQRLEEAEELQAQDTEGIAEEPYISDIDMGLDLGDLEFNYSA